MNDRYEPVVFNTKKAHAKWTKDSSFKEAYDALHDEFSALDKLLTLRREAGLSQTQVASRMGVAQASLARLETSLSTQRYTPSLQSLRKYAEAFGKRLEIRLV